LIFYDEKRKKALYKNPLKILVGIRNMKEKIWIIMAAFGLLYACYTSYEGEATLHIAGKRDYRI